MKNKFHVDIGSLSIDKWIYWSQVPRVLAGKVILALVFYSFRIAILLLTFFFPLYLIFSPPPPPHNIQES